MLKDVLKSILICVYHFASCVFRESVYVELK